MAGTVGMVEATVITGMAMVFLGMVIITAHRHHFFAHNSCWKWSPYGPVNVCYPRY